jgi:hypothetical protein
MSGWDRSSFSLSSFTSFLVGVFKLDLAPLAESFVDLGAGGGFGYFDGGVCRYVS